MSAGSDFARGCAATLAEVKDHPQLVAQLLVRLTKANHAELEVDPSSVAWLARVVVRTNFESSTLAFCESMREAYPVADNPSGRTLTWTIVLRLSEGVCSGAPIPGYLRSSLIYGVYFGVQLVGGEHESAATKLMRQIGSLCDDKLYRRLSQELVADPDCPAKLLNAFAEGQIKRRGPHQLLLEADADELKNRIWGLCRSEEIYKRHLDEVATLLDQLGGLIGADAARHWFGVEFPHLMDFDS